MKIPDSNVLLNAVNQRGPQHKRARAWLELALRGPDTIAFPWQVLLTFLRISTKRVFPNPLEPAEALDTLESWLGRSSAIVLNPGPNHLTIVRELLKYASAGDLITDIHLAALAIESGAELYSFDRDFARFPGLRWRQP